MVAHFLSSVKETELCMYYIIEMISLVTLSLAKGYYLGDFFCVTCLLYGLFKGYHSSDSFCDTNLLCVWIKGYHSTDLFFLTKKNTATIKVIKGYVLWCNNLLRKGYYAANFLCGTDFLYFWLIGYYSTDIFFLTTKNAATI